MTSPESPDAQPLSLTVRSTEDVVALVPLVLGFHPTDSVVLLTFGAPGGSFHARVDLPRGREAVEEVTALLARAVRSNAATTAMVVVCCAEQEPAAVVVPVLVPALARAGAEVVEVVRIHEGCWWSLVGPDRGPHLYDVSTHPFTAQRVLAGDVVRESRQAVVESLACSDPAAAERTGVAVEEVVAQGRDPRLEATWLRGWLADRAARSRDEPAVAVPEEEVVRALALVRLPEQREVACVDLTRQRARVLLEPWSDLVRRAPDRFLAGPATLLALTAWLAGDGALAWCALDRALAQEPDLTLARCVAQALQDAVPPSTWRGLDAEACPLLSRAAS